MRVVHLTDCYAPRLGGIEVQVAALVAHQRAAGHAATVVTATPGHGTVRAGADEVDGVPVLRLVAPMPAELPVHPLARRRVRAALRADRPDAVHVHVGAVSPFAWSAAAAARDLGLPVVVSVHSMWGPLARGAVGAAARARLLAFVRPPVVLAAVSAPAAAAVAAAAGHRVRVLPNGVDAAGWRVDHLPGDPGELRVVSTLRLAPRKRVGPLLDALAAAREALAPQVRLVGAVVGDGPRRAAARSRLVDTGLVGSVELAGRLDHAALRRRYAASDVFVQPSVRESFGLAALEARCAGLPVVVRRQSGSTDFVRDGVEGLVVDDDAGLAGALVRLGRDPGLRARIAAHNAAVAPLQDWPHVLALVDAAYADAVRAAGRG